ncbi:MAG TPA: MotA/TolQ/ExbB proton channel family protein [Deltaproteobacteria bacterium]|nr:MotA/TolQ/ExbB proton channel family protein [Deltaproteobacteria bacterium]HQB39526.1 MotA/TolQ/ExbB proton channel family protein [Deltaproteobacteria bacterium]
MNLVAGLESFLFVISSVLMLPVVAGLVLMTCWVVVFFGWFVREFLDRRQKHFVALVRYRKNLEAELAACLDPANLDIALERLLQASELKLIKSLDMIRFVIRVGPALGLMGTLIPMGISLSAMAQGDMPGMAGSMVTAFTTVVVGLACSVTAYIMSLIKEKWVRADMREMEFMTEQMLRQSGCHRDIPQEEGEQDELS